MKKRGISHVEVIVSFTIFIGIVAAIFLFIKPVREPTLSNVLLDIVEEGLRKDGTIALAKIPFKISESILNDPSNFPCFIITHPLDIGPGKLSVDNVFIKKSTGEAIPFDINSDTFEIGDRDPFLYTILFSFDETFTRTPPGGTCVQVLEDKVIFSAPRTETLFSFSKLRQLETAYNADYGGLKEKWFLPSTSDFSINISYSDGSHAFGMEKKKPPPRRDVFAREFTVNMLEETDVKQVSVNVRIW